MAPRERSERERERERAQRAYDALRKELRSEPPEPAQPHSNPDLDLLLYTGKGGVGKTTTAAATALRASAQGLRTLIVSADPAHSLADVFGPDCPPLALTQRFDADALREATRLDPYEVSSKLYAVELDARVEVRRHWARIHRYLVRLFAHQGVDESIAADLATLPGAFEIATLLAVDRAVESGAYDLVVVDCAPSASALRMTTLPEVTRGMLRVLLGLVRRLSGVALPLAERVIDAPLPDAEVFESVESLLYRQLSALRHRLTSERTAVRLVVTPEHMVIDEARRTYTDLCLFEIDCDAVVINRVLPEVDDPDPFYRALQEAQAGPLDELAHAFDPLPRLMAPFQTADVSGLAPLDALGRALFGDDSPRARCAPPGLGLRFEGPAEAPVLRLPAPGAEGLDVVKIDGELVVTTSRRRRSLPLPRRIARLPLREAHVENGELVVRFGQEGPTCA